MNTDESTTSRWVAERMLIIGGGQKGSIAGTICLRLAEDRTSVHLYLGEGLFQLALLVRSHVGKLVYIDIEVVSERHLCIKLIAEVDVVEEILAQVLRQETIGKGTLSATL